MKGLLPNSQRLEPINWQKIDEALMEKYHWTPQMIDDMTLPEIANACGSRVSEGEAWMVITAMRKLTAKQRLELGYIECGLML
jgi:hypothetical protein